MLFIYVTDYVGIWRATLTKDTLVWGATTGLVVLGGFTKATKPGYFRREFFKILNVVVIFEYLVNLSPFSLLIEIILQPIIVLFIVAPIVAEGPEQQRVLRRARNWFIAILAIVMIGHTARTLSGTWQIANWEVLALQMMWPVLLGIWVLVLVFPLAVVATYEEAFIRLRMYRDERRGLWKAKLGLMLALRFRLRWIREAAKGRTKHVANAESVRAAYEATKSYKTELAKQQEAAN